MTDSITAQVSVTQAEQDKLNEYRKKLTEMRGMLALEGTIRPVVLILALLEEVADIMTTLGTPKDEAMAFVIAAFAEQYDLFVESTDTPVH